MFESLSDRLTGALSGLRGKGRLTDADIDAPPSTRMAEDPVVVPYDRHVCVVTDIIRGLPRII